MRRWLTVVIWFPLSVLATVFFILFALFDQVSEYIQGAS